MFTSTSSSVSSSSSSSSSSSNNLSTIRTLKAPSSFLDHFSKENPQESKKPNITSLDPNYPERRILLRLIKTYPQLANPLLRGLDRLFLNQFLYYKIKDIPLIEFLKKFPAAADQISEILTIVLTKIPKSSKVLKDFYERILDIPLAHLDTLVKALRSTDSAIRPFKMDHSLDLITVMAMIEHPADADWIRQFGNSFLLGSEEFLQKERALQSLPPLEKDLLKKIFFLCGTRSPAERGYIALIIGSFYNLIDVKKDQIDRWVTEIIKSEKSLADLKNISTYLGYKIDFHRPTLSHPELFESVIHFPSCAIALLEKINETSNFLEWIGIFFDKQNIAQYLIEQPELATSKLSLIKILDSYTSLDFENLSEEIRLAARGWWFKLFECPAEKIATIINMIEINKRNFFTENWIQNNETVNKLIETPLPLLLIELAKLRIYNPRFNTTVSLLGNEFIELYNQMVELDPKPSTCFFEIFKFIGFQVATLGFVTELKIQNLTLVHLVLSNIEKLWNSLSDILEILKFIGKNMEHAFTWQSSMIPAADRIDFCHERYQGWKLSAIKNKINELYCGSDFSSSVRDPAYYITSIVQSFLEHESTNPNWLADRAKLCNQLRRSGALGKLTEKNIKQLLTGADLNYFLKALFQYGHVNLDISNSIGFSSMACLFFSKNTKPSVSLAPIENLPKVLKVNILSLLDPVGMNNKQLGSQLNTYGTVFYNKSPSLGNNNKSTSLSSSNSSESKVNSPR